MPTQSRRGRPRVPLTLAPPERAELESFARSRALPAGLVRRAQMLLLSTDPFFVEKLRDVVGLYLNPPDHALVLSVDEKSQVQALERTQPGLPLGLGYVQGITHDYYRHGTTTLFAALDVAAGTVLHQCKPRHRHQEFLAFLRYLDAQVPPHLDVHLIVDNYGTHKHAKVRRWLARHPRYHLHFTPTYASWLNQTEPGRVGRREGEVVGGTPGGAELGGGHAE